MARKKSRSADKDNAEANAEASADTQKAPAKKRRARKNDASRDETLRYVVHGTLSYPDGAPAGDLTVVAFDKDVGGEDRLGETVSDGEGGYRIEYSDARFRRSPSESGGADVIVRVHSPRGEKLLQSKTVRNAPPDLELNVEIPDGVFVVSGKVRDADGLPLANRVVRAFDRDLRREERLGEDTTAQDGSYRIAYTRKDFLRSERASADLLVRVYAPEADEPSAQALAESAVVFNAPAVAEVHLRVPGSGAGRSELERLLVAIVPLLAGQAPEGGDLPLAALTEADIDFIVGETGFDRDRVRLLALAAQRAQGDGTRAAASVAMKSYVDTSGAHAIPDDGVTLLAFYAWFRQGLPTSLETLLATDDATLSEALETSQRDNVIPQLPAGGLERALGQVQRLRVADVLRAGADGDRSSLGDLLRVGLAEDKHTAIASAWVVSMGTAKPPGATRAGGDGAIALENLGGAQPFLAALSKVEGLTADDVQHVRTTLALDDLTGGHLPLVRELSRVLLDGPPGAGLAGLARLDERDWVEVLERPSDPDDPASAPIGAPAGVESLTSYARQLGRAIERSFPTQVIASHLAGEVASASPFAETRTDLVTFFDNNPGFALGQTPLTSYLADEPKHKLRDVEDPDRLEHLLARMERVAKFAPRPRPMEALLADDVHSAQAVLLLGEREFTRRYAPAYGGDEAAGEAFVRATAIGLGALNLYLKLATRSNDPLPYVLDPLGEGAVDASAFPDADRATWRTLFGSLDLCDCDHCQSLYSASAYFVDLLVFLRQQSDTQGATPLDVLLARRPDLAQLELTCDNTNLRLPYVDLVNEVLENAVADPAITVTGDFSAADFDQGTLVGELRQALALSAKATLSTQVRGSSWVIRDTGQRYVFAMNEARTGVVVRPFAQTAPSEAELAANPRHLNLNAYATLARAGYPWHLPLDLPVEQARVYLRQLGVERHALMASLETASGALASDAIAAEYLGLSTVAASIVTGATTRDPNAPAPTGSTAMPWTFWGFASPNPRVNDPAQPTNGDAYLPGGWEVVLKTVPVFLARSGLSYRDLLELLSTYFINPSVGGARALSIRSKDATDPATCDLAKLEIDGLNGTVLDRIHRFERLRRALGWSARDLDRAIAAFAATDLTPALLRQVSHVQRLKARLGLPVVALLAFWADIDTAAYASAGGEGRDPVDLPSFYEELFRNKAVVNPLDEAFREDARTLTGPLAERQATILGALRIDAAAFALLSTGTNAVVTGNGLNLANLSALYRHAALARALKLSTADLLQAGVLVGGNPFGTTAETLDFVARIDALRATGFDVASLSLLLRDETHDERLRRALDAHSAGVLSQLRVGLTRIEEENASVADPLGEVTRSKLASLRWSGSHIERAIALLGDAESFATALTSLPAGIELPASLRERIAFDGEKGTLSFLGVMSEQDRTELRRATADPGADLSAYLDAVDKVFAASRRSAKGFLAERMRAFELPVFSAPAGSQRLARVDIPERWKNQVQYDTAAGKLRAVGPVTDEDHAALLRVSGATDYQAAVNSLVAQAKAYDPGVSSRFLIFVSPTDPATDPARSGFSELFDAGRSTAERFDYVLRRISAYLRRTSSDSLVKQTLTDAFDLDAAAVDVLLTALLSAPSDPTRRRAIADLVSPTFVRSRGEITASYYPDQFAVLARVRKVAQLAARFRLTAGQLTWISRLAAPAGWLDFNALPAVPSARPVAFAAWEKLVVVLGLRGAPFNDDNALATLVALANDPATTRLVFFQALSAASGWAPADLTVLAGAPVATGTPQDTGLLRLRFPEDFRDGEGIARIRACFALLDRLGAGVAELAPWSRPDLADELPTATRRARAFANARALRNAVRAHYDDAQWSAIARPLQDRLRARQREALVGYLVAGGRFGADEADLYDHFLIDVEMSACMMTTRLKQATCSVQLFVQRCLMNLEPQVRLTPGQAHEWHTWRKLYRVWEANRKVLLYPENWIEPELRDDKSPFFEELENELLQNDVTAATAEDAVRRYLQRLDQVARLEIVGLHRQRRASDTAGARDIVHVFGRTCGLPHLYFYRRLEDGVWTAWQKVDLDIEGDHLIPVVWNDRLYLAWPIVTDKTRHPSKSERANDDDPRKYWEIKLAWSQLERDKWLPKKISGPFLEHVKHPQPNVPQEREDFKFLARIQTGAFGSRLLVECYGTVIERTVIAPKAPPPPPPPRPDVLMVAAGGFQTVVITFTANGTPLLDDELSSVRVLVRDRASGAVIRSLTPAHVVGIATVAWVHDKSADYYFPAGAFSLASVMEGPAPPLFRNLMVDLSPYHAAVPVASTPEQPTVVEKPVRSRAIGRFQFDDSGTDVSAFASIAAVPPIEPPGLEPLAGTRFVDMMMVEHLNWLDRFGSAGVLGKTPGTFRVLNAADSYGERRVLFPFAFQDGLGTYLVHTVERPGGGIGGYKARFETLYHPWVRSFVALLNRRGLPGLLTLDAQSLREDAGRFEALYLPNPTYVDLDSDRYPGNETPREEVDFSRGGAYSLYNWELFFHVPLLIATRLGANQRFEEARTWFHYLFDPTSSEPGGRERFWRFRPFIEEAGKTPVSLADFLKAESDAFAEQQAAWRARPFQPYVIARLRLLAFMKTVVMKYVDNLIAWGDHLFARDTIEAINEATQLYLLAARILGKRPEAIPPRAKPKVQTFHTLAEQGSGALFAALVDIESYVFPAAAPAAAVAGSGTAGLGTMPLFCLPRNDKLLGYWDTVADRLFKIRHCMNLAGVTRELPIFDPPIDPALLVRAAAAGVDLDSVLNDLYAPMPHYRYAAMARRAGELCNDLKALGAALLAALEKKDAEALALLRSGHEIEMLSAVRQVRERQVEEARSALDGLIEYQKVVTARQQYYLSRPFMNMFETAHALLTGLSLLPMQMHLGADTTAAILHLIPDSKVGAPPTIGATYGGRNVAGAIQAFGSALGTMTSMLNTMGSLSATMGGYSRRQDDWTHQADLATKELAQVEKQIAAAEIRLAIAEHERANHETQIDNAREVDSYLREKYTNAQLYDWMVGQLSAIYFQSYRLAYDVARRAERCYRAELGLADSSHVRFGYWDSLKKGLLAGERLQLDLRRMEVDYAERNKREFEITRHVSVLALDPVALIALRESGRCEIAIPEALFDIDCPGHYLRRLRAVSVTLPCVTGPYVGVNCTLTLLRSSVRSRPDIAGGYARNPGGEDARFTDAFGAAQSVVTSTGQNDSGLFETNLNDERYLPFEGAGAISTWRVELPAEFRPFDYSTISDVVLHLRYTARNGGDAFKQKVLGELQTQVNELARASGGNGLARLVSLRHEFPTEWSRFVGEPVAGDNRVTVTLGSDRFPYLFAGRTVSVDRVQLFVKIEAARRTTLTPASLKSTFVAGTAGPGSANHSRDDLLALTDWSGVLRAEASFSSPVEITSTAAGAWTLNAWRDDGSDPTPLDPTALDDLVLVFHYEV